VGVLEQQCVVVGVVGIDDFDNRKGSGTDILDECLFDLAPIVLVSHAGHYMLVAPGFVFEEIEFADQLLGEITAQKGSIAFDLAHLEQFFLAGLFARTIFFDLFSSRMILTLFDIFPNFHADMIWIEAARRWTKDLGVADNKF